MARFLGAFVFFAAAAAAQPQPHPNILWISSEDNGPDLGCYACPDADTPNLDALAATGIRYTACSSNYPVCAPARTTIINGSYAASLGAGHMRSRVALPATHRMFPQYLRDAGYYCTNNSKQDYNTRKPGKVWDESSNKAHWRSPSRAPNQPFFAVFNLTITHESQVRKRPHTPIHDPATIHLPPHHPDTPEVRRDWAQYHDKITAMDRRAGEIVKQLRDDGLGENTIVFYWGDHGAGMPGHKRNPKQAGLHVPLIIRIPERFRPLAGDASDTHPITTAPGTISDRLVAFVDFGPTVLSLAGIPTPSHMQGRAFLGPHRTPPKRYTHGFRGRMDERYDLVRTVRDERYLYVRNYYPWLPLGKHVAYMFQTPTTQVWWRLFNEAKLPITQASFWLPREPEELYDLATDPYCTTNLAASPNHSETLHRLRLEHLRHTLAIGDVAFVPEADMLARSVDSAPYHLTHGANPPVDLPHLLDTAWRASSRDPTAEKSLAVDTEHSDPAVRFWALQGLMHRGAETFARHRATFTRMLDDPSPSVQVVAAEGLCIHTTGAEQRAGLERLAKLADRRNASLLVAVAAWNALDGLDAAAEPVLPVLRAIPEDVSDVPNPFRNYLPRLRDKTLGDLRAR